MALHELDIRIKYVLNILHQVLILLLKFMIKNHKHCINNKVDIGKGLVEVLNKNLREFKGTKLCTDPIYKKHFFAINPNTNKLTKNLKTSIELESLDISVLTLLLKKKFIYKKTILKQCCVNCKHDKCSCGLDPKICDKKSNCGLGGCLNCNSSSCYLVKILNFCDISRSLRNCFAHVSNNDVYQTLEIGNGDLDEFPKTKKWIKLWHLVNLATCACLKIVLKHDKKLLPMESYKDFQMELWFALRKQKQCLLMLVESDLNNFYQTVLGRATYEEQTAKILNEIKQVKKGLLLYVIKSFSRNQKN